MSRYLVADEPSSLWGHIFDGRREVMTRFVFDQSDLKLLAAQIKWDANGGWSDANAVELADLEDSLVNANEDALDDPANYGLLVADDLPDWAAALSPAPAASR